MNKKLEIIEHLEALGNGLILPRNLKEGICEEIVKNFDIDLIELKQYFIKWSKYSGDDIYPVPPLQYESAEDEYNMAENKWIDEQGELRRDLCLHIAREMRKEFRL